MTITIVRIETTGYCEPHFQSRFRTFRLVKLRTIHFRQILSNLYSPPTTGPTQTSMSNTLQGGIRRVEKRHTLPRVCRQLSNQLTALHPLSTSLHPQLSLSRLCAPASLPTSFHFPHTLSHGPPTQPLHPHTRDHIRTVLYGTPLTKGSPQQLLPPDYSHITVRFQCRNFIHKTHPHCPRPNVYWDVKMKRTFLSHIDAIQSHHPHRALLVRTL
jgi:hypothetical protein